MRGNMSETFLSEKRKKNSRTDTWENPHLRGTERIRGQRSDQRECRVYYISENTTVSSIKSFRQWILSDGHT